MVNWDKDSIILKIKEFYDENQRTPLAKDFTGNKKYPGRQTVINNFGAWNIAIESAGFTARHKAVSKESLIQNIQDFFKKHNRIPLSTELTTKTAYQTYFGSWNKAIEAAGFTPNNINGFGILTKANDGKIYKSTLEAYFVNNYLLNKHEYVYEPKYDNHHKWYDFYLPNLDLYIEIDGNCRPKVIQDKIIINSKENKKLLVLTSKEIYSNKEIQCLN